MKVKMIEVEGSAEELANAPEILAALRGSSSDGAGDNGKEVGITASGLSKELTDYIRRRAGTGEMGRRVESWVAEVLSWGTTESILGTTTNKRSPDGYVRYVRLHNVGPHKFGAFAYVYARRGTVRLRVTAKQAQGYDQAMIGKHRTYAAVISLMTDDGYKQALDLARVALAGVQP
jgi:hypothetical protein